MTLVPQIGSNHATGPWKGPDQVRRVAVLGSTGSIGQSALEVVRRHRERFEVVGLTAGSNARLLAAQVEEFRPGRAALRFEGAGSEREALAKLCKLELGEEAVCGIASDPRVDVVVAGTVGVAGLAPVLAALEAGKLVALANKESLVCGGALVARALAAGGGAIVPVDSEHSAIFQCLQGERSMQCLESLVLTASGGPFLDTPVDALRAITPAQAVKHPRWQMGAKISIDSASMMNKALEVIEAHRLFGLPARRIEVLVHPQSIVHSLVKLADGTQLAQLSHPDMKGPIAYAMSFPNGRLDRITPELDLASLGSLTFRPLDDARFPAVSLAKECLEQGGSACAIFNLANENAVARFMAGELRFTEIVPFVRKCLESLAGAECGSLDELRELEDEVARFGGGQFERGKVQP